MKKSNSKVLKSSMDKTKSDAQVQNTAQKQDSHELDDDLLEDVAGGLVQLVNPSSSRL
jgi:hypothetical protein